MIMEKLKKEFINMLIYFIFIIFLLNIRYNEKLKKSGSVFDGEFYENGNRKNGIYKFVTNIYFY